MSFQPWNSLGTRTTREQQVILTPFGATFIRLQQIGPNFGYCPEISKSILVVPQRNLEAAQLAFADLGFEVTTGHRYLGGFLGGMFDDSAA
jgi:hypothetical protein